MGPCPDDLAAAVVALTGEVTERASAAVERERSWSNAFAGLDALVLRRPELTDWYGRLRSTGLVRRLARTPEAATGLLADLVEVLDHLPADGEPLGRFAVRTAGDAHALDDDRPLATLALAAARAISGVADGSGAAWRREVWASVGLLKDDVSSTVLTFRLRGDAETTTGRALAACHDGGQPAVLTLRQLVNDPPRLRPELVSICENPVVVSAAADELGTGCPPLVCTSGQPGAAVMHLLRLLASSGARLRYHGDFDWGGLRIANLVLDKLPAVPWRLATTDYLHAVSNGRELTGTPTVAAWDDRLAPAMRERGIAVEEEQVIDDLLYDLSGSDGDRRMSGG